MLQLTSIDCTISLHPLFFFVMCVFELQSFRIVTSFSVLHRLGKLKNLARKIFFLTLFYFGYHSYW